jgi:autotransporter-associated beta strand protein
MLLAAGSESQGFFNLNTGGSLNIGGAEGIAKGSGNGSFNLAGGILKVTASSLTTSVTMTLTNTSAIDTNGLDCTLSGVLSGPGNLVKITGGTLALNAANHLTGGTTLWAGTIRVGTPTSLGAGPLAHYGGTLDLAFTGTATVQSLTFDGNAQASGTWGSLDSSATHKSSRITGTGLLNVASSPPPAINTAASTGLSHVLGGADIDLATATGATPPGGTFSGPAVSGGIFSASLPGYGYGLHTITYTVGGQSTTFTISVIGGLTLDEEGGGIALGNLATGGTAFAKDALNHPNHAILHLNDGTYGNSFSWIGTTADSYAGVSLGATPIPVSRIAFGRDNTGAFNDRCLDYYTIQYTSDPAPESPSATWFTIGAVNYRPGGTAGITAPARRHLFSFPAVSATGLRIKVSSETTAIDEIEVYPATGLFATSGLTLLQEGGTPVPDNLAPEGIAFSKDEIGGAPHSRTGVNDGTYGNASSWIGGTANSFVGITLAAASTIDRIAFGRDNTGVIADRAMGRYALQYTTVANPGATTPDASWTTLGILDYQTATGANFANPSQRHLYAFPSIIATGVRLLAPSNAAIDELEVSLGKPQLLVEHPVGTALAAGSLVDFGGRFPVQPAVKTYTVTNSGSSPVTFGAVVVNGAHAGDFSVTAPGPGALAPGATTSFTVTFTPGESGPRFAAIHLPTNDPAIAFSMDVIGSGLVPTFNAATSDGLIMDTANGLMDLPATTAATPAGGAFSGPGVTGLSGASFDPAAAGFGTHTLTYSFGGAVGTFEISVVGGLALVGEGGSFLPNNMAPAGIAFASDVIPGFEAHTISHLNDATYGNANSWIGNSANTFAGINLGATPVAVNRIAFGRDNTAIFTDRCVDHYIVQYTTASNPDAATTAWTSIGAVDYRSPSFPNPALRHLFSFPTVNATGLRIITATAGTAIDEIELYSPNTPHELWRLSYFNSSANTGDAADHADPNHNGIPNLIEYALGGHPVDGSTGQSILPTGSRPGNQMQLHFTRLLDRDDIDLTVQASGDLDTWTDLARSTAGQPFALIESGTGIDESGSGNTRAVTITDPAGGTRRFLRLSVTPSPTP